MLLSIVDAETHEVPLELNRQRTAQLRRVDEPVDFGEYDLDLLTAKGKDRIKGALLVTGIMILPKNQRYAYGIWTRLDMWPYHQGQYANYPVLINVNDPFLPGKLRGSSLYWHWDSYTHAVMLERWRTPLWP